MLSTRRPFAARFPVTSAPKLITTAAVGAAFLLGVVLASATSHETALRLAQTR